MKKRLLLLFFSVLSVAVHANAAVQHQDEASAAAADPQPLQVQQHSDMVRTRSLLQAPKPDCPATCLLRCANNWMKEMCNKMCNVCCNKCSCVPPGTGQDTRHLCPCYDTMINPHTGKLKCP